MADITAYKVVTGQSAKLKDTGYLDNLATYRGADKRILCEPIKLTSSKLTQGKGLDLSQATRVYIVPNYYADLYKCIIVIPHLVSLGSISTEQGISVQVWNANREAVRLLSVTVDGGEGITLSGPTTPSTFNGLALKKWQVTVSMAGPAVIDCTVTFKFLGKNPVTLKITGSRSTDWSFMPDWSDNVRKP